MHPKFDPTGGSNSLPPDHNSTLHVTETPALTATGKRLTLVHLNSRMHITHVLVYLQNGIGNSSNLK